MSFAFNHSSDEDDLDEWNRNNSFARPSNSNKPLATCNSDDDETTSFGDNQYKDGWSNPFAKAVITENDDFQSDSDQNGAIDWELLKDDESEDDCVDWEDADNNSQASAPDIGEKLVPVTVDFTKRDTSTNIKDVTIKKKRSRIRKSLRLKILPHNVQLLVQNLHRCHVLALTCHTTFLSSVCYQYPEVLAVAHSVLPTRWISKQHNVIDSMIVCPSLSDVRSFLTWFFDLVHGAESRIQRRRRMNRAAGAPRVQSQSTRTRRKRRLDETSNTAQSDDCVDYSGSPLTNPKCVDEQIQARIISFAQYLGLSQLDDPQLRNFEHTKWTNTEICLLLVAMIRSMGWRCRYVHALNPMKLDLDVSHPLLGSTIDLFRFACTQKFESSDVSTSQPGNTGYNSSPRRSEPHNDSVYGWIEILCSTSAKDTTKQRWIHVDPVKKLVDQPSDVETILSIVWNGNDAETSPNLDKKVRKQGTTRIKLAYAIGAEHSLASDENMRIRLTDVTPRYAQSWIAALLHRGVIQNKKSNVEELYKTSWWVASLKSLNENLNMIINHSAEIHITGVNLNEHVVEQQEANELRKSAHNEAIPTSKSAFQTHPVYVIPSVLGASEVLAPDAKARVCGMFRGEFVYRRSEVSTAFPAKKWLYQGRKVLPSELKTPVKQVAARKKPTSKSFRALKTYGVGQGNDGSTLQRESEMAKSTEELDDGKNYLYAIWQTEPWSPPYVGPNDTIPVNDYNNVELSLINSGLVHIDIRGMAKVAKKLGIPYAPCMIGFEGNGGNRTPSISGIVVHSHNEQLLREAGVEVTSHAMEEERDLTRQRIHQRWKRLMLGALTKERVEREYG